MVRGTTVGGLSAKYCLSVSESILVDMFAVVLNRELELGLEQHVAGVDQWKRWGVKGPGTGSAGYRTRFSLRLRRVSDNTSPPTYCSLITALYTTSICTFHYSTEECHWNH